MAWLVRKGSRALHQDHPASFWCIGIATFLCRSFRHLPEPTRQMTPAEWRKPLIRRAGEMGCGLPYLRQMLLFRGNRNGSPHNTLLEAGDITIRVVRAFSQAAVTVSGRVTVDSSPPLRSALLQLLHRGTEPSIVVDLSGVSYLDMSGLATLLEALRAARQSSKRLRVLGITGQSRLLAEIAELDKIFQAAGGEVEFQ